MKTIEYKEPLAIKILFDGKCGCSRKRLTQLISRTASMFGYQNSVIKF